MEAAPCIAMTQRKKGVKSICLTVEVNPMNKSVLLAITLLPIAFMLLPIAFKSWSEVTQPPVNCLEDFTEEEGPYVYEDYCIYEAQVGNITTIDIKIKAEGNALNYDIPYSNLRYRGAIIQIYINGAFGKDQWVAMPFLRGVFLMSNSIHLPIDEWVEDGFPVGKYIRVVIIHSE